MQMKIQMTRLSFALLLIMGLALAACGAGTAPAGQSAAESGAAPETAGPQDSSGQPPASSSAVTPVAVTAFTPAQQEGPYYPVDKPADHDNDLVDFAGAEAPAAGDILHLSGVVYGAGGLPLEGAAVEIWQTDQSGVYRHPDDPGTERRDRNFQFSGESVTGADGVYSFRTIMPGPYEPRPRHIHVKVRYNGEEILTTQFYFADEVSAGGAEANLLVETAPAEDDSGAPILVGQRHIFLRVDQ